MREAMPVRFRLASLLPLLIKGAERALGVPLACTVALARACEWLRLRRRRSNTSSGRPSCVGFVAGRFGAESRSAPAGRGAQHGREPGDDGVQHGAAHGGERRPQSGRARVQGAGGRQAGRQTDPAAPLQRQHLMVVLVAVDAPAAVEGVRERTSEQGCKSMAQHLVAVHPQLCGHGRVFKIAISGAVISGFRWRSWCFLGSRLLCMHAQSESAVLFSSSRMRRQCLRSRVPLHAGHFGGVPGVHGLLPAPGVRAARPGRHARRDRPAGEGAGR
jgi:hypothetical protein